MKAALDDLAENRKRLAPGARKVTFRSRYRCSVVVRGQRP
jgi:hypothetical protein